ncbi:recombinase family protein [Flavobacterium terrae]|uniref:recombinase family protein n=1 Tax=Flavobacterium terrae TaxID=415425 RepID=UPI000A03690F
MKLEDFKIFQKAKNVIAEKIKIIWGYTRVSSKEQFTNFSLEDQETDIRRYAENHGLEITNMVGGTYESASGDFSRKEFAKLINQIKTAKVKPYAVAIRTINRFSRSGGGAITIVYDLVEKMGVHLIETSTGLCTDNEYEKLEIYKKLLEARKENLDRLKLTLPGMIKLLENGNWLGKAPRGYIVKGKKVNDFSRMQAVQEVVITEEGKHIAKAWKWKLAGERDYVIRQKLDLLGVTISKQRMSDMWKNPFYCGISVNNLLPSPVKGKWKPLISEADFWKIQNQINEGKPNGPKEHSKSKICPERPLTSFVRCTCGSPLTSYVVQKKSLHYYKCQQCKDASFNAYTTKRSSNDGLNNLFEDLLLKYTLGEKFIEPFKCQLNRMFQSMNNEGNDELKATQSKIESIKTKLQTLETRYISNPDFETELYNRYKKEFKAELESEMKQMDIAQQKISNHAKYIDSVVEVAKNIRKTWVSGDIENKLRVQKLVFPDGIVINPKKRQYLTKKVNQIFQLTSTISRDDKSTENKKPIDDIDGSCLVAGTGLEPVTFGL